MTDRDALLDAAHRIGRRVAGQAQWSGGACTWTVVRPDRSDPANLKAAELTGGGSVYSGTAGIALFLLELHRATGDREAARAAEGAIRWAMADPDVGATLFGFYSGRVGVAYAAARAGLIEEAGKYLAPLSGQEHGDIGDDVIAGAAGSIPALLRLAPLLDQPALLETAVRLGERLIGRARREPGGWSWGDARQVTHARNLCGYAHGASGIGQALLELYHATGDARFRYAAGQAFLYERPFFDPEAGDWPDFRHKELGDYVYKRRFVELRRRLVEDPGAMAFVPRYMTAWCHGAAGIAPTRVRAWQLLDAHVYHEEAGAALATVRRLVDVESRQMGNYSLCHGIGGNADALLEADGCGLPDDRALAERAALDGIERYELAGIPWPCGTLGGASDPGLLLGESGIGYFLLRVADPATPSVLMLTAPGAPAPERPATRHAADRLHRESVALYFGTTLASMDRAGASLPLPASDGAGAPPGVADAHAAIRARVEGERDPALRERLADALALDEARYGLARSITDFSEEYRREIATGALRPLDVGAGLLRLAPFVRVVRTRWDWDAALAAGAALSAAPAETYHLLHRGENRIRSRRLHVLGALAFLALERGPRTLEEIVDFAAEALPRIDRDALRERMREQLEQAAAAGLVDRADHPWARG